MVNAMNILVVEDEHEVRKGIVSLLSSLKPTMMVFEAEYGARALTVMEQNMMDIVLTDIRMPEIDGLQLLEVIRKRFPSSIVIMLSAYPDFSYVQKALSLGASDYLLKPVGAAQIEEVITKAISTIQRENNSRFTIEHNHRIVMQNALRDLMNQVPIDYVNYELQAELDQTAFTLLHLAAQRHNGMPNDKLFWYSVQNMFEELVTPSLGGKPNFITNYLGLIVILPHKPGRSVPELETPINTLRAEADKVLKCKLRFWQSRAYDSLTQLAEAYQQFLHEYYRTSDRKSEDKTDLILALTVSIKNLDYEQSVKLMSDLLLHPGHTFEQAKENAFEITLLLGKEIDSLDTSVKIQLKRTMMNMKPITEMASKFEVLEALQDCVGQLIAQLRNEVRGERHYAIRKVIGYIQDHLAGDFTLKDVADHIFLNESYLSTLFKNEVGETFSEYVLNMRMKKASALLLSTDTPIQDISQLVGYPNYGYFSQVFRKYYGISPSSYRKNKAAGQAGG
jgi:two-component system response regulator YesN